MSVLFNLYGMIAAGVADGVDGIEHVDIDLGQLKKDGQNIPMEYPAMLIRFENIFWKDFDAAKQIGVIHIRLKIIYPYVNETEYYTREHGIRTEVETFYTLIEDVHSIVKDLFNGTFTKPKRFNENHLETSPDGLKWIYCLDYYTNLYSDGSDIDEEVVFDLDYDRLLNDNGFLGRTVEGKKVG